MARKKKAKAEESMVEAKAEESMVEAKAEDPAPLAYPKSSEPEDPYLFKWKGKTLSHDETSYIRNTLSGWLYSAKGVDKRPGSVTQKDFEESMKDGKFARKIAPWLS